MALRARSEPVEEFLLHDKKALEWLAHLEEWAQKSEADIELARLRQARLAAGGRSDREIAAAQRARSARPVAASGAARQWASAVIGGQNGALQPREAAISGGLTWVQRTDCVDSAHSERLAGFPRFTACGKTVGLASWGDPTKIASRPMSRPRTAPTAAKERPADAYEPLLSPPS